MDDRFLECWFNRPHTLCGRRLRPYCLGHYLGLSALASPFLDPADGVATPADLLRAVRVCTAGWPFQPDLRPTLADWFRRRRLERDPARFRAACQAFQDYLDDHCALPEFYEDVTGAAGDGEDAGAPTPNTGRPISAPDALARACLLTRRGQFTEERAWSMPVGLAAWYLGGYAEIEGGGRRFVDPEDAAEAATEVPAPSEKEIYAEARRALGREAAREWRKKRTAARRREARRNRRKPPTGEGS